MGVMQCFVLSSKTGFFMHIVLILENSYGQKGKKSNVLLWTVQYDMLVELVEFSTLVYDRFKL